MESVGKWLWMMTVLVIWFQVVNGYLEQEKAALLQLKQHLGDQLPFEIQSQWLASLASWKEDKTSDCCDAWKGVMCGPNYRVVSLSLTVLDPLHPPLVEVSNSLEVHFNASILVPFAELRELTLNYANIKTWAEDQGAPKLSLRLKSLELLDLRSNRLNVSNLSQFRGYSSLKSLTLSSNNLEGVQFHDIEAISPNLEVLSLSDNKITGFLNHSGSTKLSSSLKVLKLSRNTLDNNIISQLSGFQSLQRLYLISSQLTGIVSINALHQLRNLEVLDFSNNYYITGFTNYNASFYGGLTSLKALNLGGNQLGGEIPLWLRNLTSLETLYLNNNQLIGNIGSSPLVHLLSLRELSLSSNHLLIPDSFQSFANHTKLKRFVGDYNQVVRDVVQPCFPLRLQLQLLSLTYCALFAYPSFLPYQRDLVLFDLSYNSIQDEFPPWLFENNLMLDKVFFLNSSLTGSLQLPSLTHAYLTEIWVGQNKIRGHIPANISVVFPKLVKLYLSDNGFKGNIPSSIGDLNSLEFLELSNNHLSGKINHLPKSLKFLDLSNNEFKGELPLTKELKSLEVLLLQGNNYSSGLQMDKFGPALEVLNISSNLLEGLVPKRIFSSSKLRFLDLSFNRLMGPLPIFLNSNITTLNLRNNRLSGHVTDSFCYATPLLAILDLSNNDLKGHLPDAIGNLTHLQALLLRGNQLQGQIPFQLCSLAGLNILDLSSNNLRGSIPTCLDQIATIPGSIERLDGISFGNAAVYFSSFYKVEFTTKNMPYSYKGNGILKYMSGIDLSCNKLAGHIPHELGNLGNIHAFNLSHNQLQGVIPSAFSNLKNIESLDLSYNHLNGRIPSEVTNLNTLEVFNVSYNNLSGRIPFQGQSSTFDASSYQGNPFLCGLPLPVNCTTDESPPTSTSESQDEDSSWIDMEAFYITFAGSGVTMFLAVVIIMLINPHWWNAWFYLVKASILSSYYFFEDSIRKLMRARRV